MALVLASLAAGSMLAGDAAAVPVPVVITDVCANTSQGQLSVPLAGGGCASTKTLHAVDDPNAVLQTCYLNSNGAIRKVSSSTACVTAPRSKKETALLVPSLTTDLYFCANNSDGVLFFKGTSAVTCKSGQYLVVIEQANTPPVPAAGTLTTLEDTLGTTTLSATDEDGNAITFAIASQGTKGTAALVGSPSCNGLTPSTCTIQVNYTPAANANGQDSFTFTASDGLATSAPATVAVTITPVNDAPSFTGGGDQFATEDTGLQSVPGWASAISAGPLNESGQALSFVVIGYGNAALFAVPPAVSPSGDLTYTLAPDANGTAQITIKLTDDGGTAGGGDDDSDPQQFWIVVDAVNDPPSFQLPASPDQTVLEDSGPHSVPGFAQAMSTGPADESAQTLTFAVTNGNNALFSAQPDIDATTGNLTYALAPNANGAATVSVTLSDSGSGDNTSAPQTFSITVTAVNDAPSFDPLAGDPAPVNEDSFAVTVPGFATGMTAGPANENGQALTFVFDPNFNTALFDGLAGLPLIDAATGTLTYTLAPNAYGTALITVKLTDNGGTAAGGDDDSDTQSFEIVVNPVNDAPSFALPASPDQTAPEDAVAQTAPGFATAISAGPNEASQVLTFNVTNGNNALFSAQPDIDETTGDLTYTPAPNANGSTTVFVSLSDDAGGTSGVQSFQLTITPVNDEPSFTVGADQSVVQDAGAQIVPAFATSISAGPSDESSQALTFHASTDNDALFATLPAINASGDLTYEPATGATGSATVTVHLTDDGGTANGGDDTSAPQDFEITVALPNATPVAVFQTGINAVVTNEDTPTTITLTATDADDDDLTFSVVDSPSHGTLVATGTPDCTTTANTCTATFDYTPDGDYAGADIFTFKANDGLVDSSPGTVDVVMLAINDAPSFTKGADETVLEDAGAQTVNGWATAISPGGGADEAGQAVTFNITGNTNAALFSAAPAVSSDGHLTYTPAANAFGSATITIEAQDDLGAPSAAETFVINVTAVNDAPTFTAGANQSVGEDAAAQSVSGWATAISKGPANESGQTLAFAVTGNTDAGLFSVAPAVSPEGTLTYTPAPNQHGTATITLKLTDNGGTANGGVAESATQQFDITVTAVNDAPTSPGRAYGASSLQANMQRSIDAAGGLLVGVADADDVAGNGSYTPSITLGTVNGATPASGTITTTIAGTGTVVANAATGAFTINPAPGVTGNVSFTYTVCDTGEGTPASACSAPATASFNIAGPVIWFVNPAAATNGNGTLTSPFNTLASADAVDAANQRVFVYNGTTTTGLALNTGEWLIGQPASGGPFDTFFSIAPPAGTIARPTMGSGTTTIGGTVSVATDARVQGIALATAGAAGLTGTGPITGVSVSETSVTTTTGTAVNLNDAAGSYTLSSVSTNGAANGILLTALGASNVTVNGGTIVAAGTRGIDISGGTGDFSYTGSITTAGTGRSVEVTGHTGGTVAFSGSIADTGLGINLDGNAGATLNFSGGLTLSTSTNAAFRAAGSGTVNVTGSNTLATTTGTALTVTDTTIGASDLTFQSIAANGAVNGIVLSNTGSSGGLTVGGGTIQNTTGNGISLTSTRDVSLSAMSILSTGGSGISGTGVTNFSFVSGTISNSGDAGFESNIAFDGGGTNLGNNLAGTLTITGSTLTNAFHSGLNLQADNGTVTDAVITGNTITSTTSTATSKGTGINIVGVGSASTVFNLTKATIDNNVITNFPSGAGIQVNTGNTNTTGPGATAGTPGSATNVVTITNNRIQGASAVNRMGTHAILVTNNGGNPGSRGQMNVNVSGNGTVANPLTNITGIVIGVGNNGSATMTGTVANNRIVANNTLASGGISGGNGVVTSSGTETPDLTLTVTGNAISQTDGNGILLVGRGTSGIARLKIQNNTVGAALSGVRPGIRIDAGNATSGDDSVCLNISGNTSAGSGGSQGIGLRKQGTVSTTNDFAINGMAATATPGVEAYVNGLNPAGGGTLLISATSGFSGCSLP